MTPEYCKHAELEWTDDGELAGWVQPGEPGWFLPPLRGEDFATDVDVWAGFLNDPGPRNQQELDRQYIYDARCFRRLPNLHGKKWRTFRKGVRKYPSDHSGSELVYRKLDSYADADLEEEIGEMLLNWAEGKIIQDPDVMASFLFFGNLRWGLFNDGKLVGVNVVDKNPSMLVYRYCLEDGSRCLQEYMRWLFYSSDFAQGYRMVNDGGDLGNDSLAWFKRRLNPVDIMRVYTYSG